MTTSLEKRTTIFRIRETFFDFLIFSAYTVAERLYQGQRKVPARMRSMASVQGTPLQ